MNKGKTGLEIISGLIIALRRIAAVADAVIKEGGLSISDPRLCAARVQLEAIMSLATDPSRRAWLKEAVEYMREDYLGWFESRINHVVRAEEFQKLYKWTIPSLRDNCIDTAKRLEEWEPRVRNGARQASQKILALLDE